MPINADQLRFTNESSGIQGSAADGSISLASNIVDAVGRTATGLRMVRLWHNQWVTIGPRMSAVSTTDTYGSVAPTSSGTRTSSVDADGSWVRCATGNVSGNTAGWVTSAAMVIGCLTVTRIKTHSDITSQRIWVGVSNLAIAADAPTQQVAAFRFSTVAGDTTWRCYVRNQTTATTENGDSGVTVTASTVYELGVYTTTSNIFYYINSDLVYTSSAVPDTTFAYLYNGRIETQTAAIRNLDFAKVEILQG